MTLYRFWSKMFRQSDSSEVSILWRTLPDFYLFSLNFNSTWSTKISITISCRQSSWPVVTMQKLKDTFWILRSWVAIFVTVWSKSCQKNKNPNKFFCTVAAMKDSNGPTSLRIVLVFLPHYAWSGQKAVKFLGPIPTSPGLKRAVGKNWTVIRLCTNTQIN